MCKPEKNKAGFFRYLRSKKSSISCNNLKYIIAGPLVVVHIIILCKILLINGMRLPVSLFNILVIAIIYSVYAGGIMSGFISVSVVVFFSVLNYTDLINLFYYTSIASPFVFINLIILCLLVLMVGIMKKRLRRETQQLKEIQENLNRAEALSLVMVCYTALDGRLIKVTPNLCKLLGYTEQELHSLKSGDISHPDDFDEDWQNCLRLMKGEIKSFDMRKRYVRKDGQIVWVYINRSIVTDASGRPLHFLSYIRDITNRKHAEEERKRAEVALCESEERYRKLVELSPDAIFVVRRYEILFTNTAGAQLLGAENPEKLVGKSILDFVHPDYMDVNLIRIAKVQEEGMNVPLLEEKFIKLDGTTIEVESASIPISYDGEKSMLSLIRDISDRRKVEELQENINENKRLLDEAMEYENLRSEFFANISHELRTPITLMFTTMQMYELYSNECLQVKEGERKNRHVKIMKQNCFRLLKLINNLIDITKIDTGYFEINLQNYDIVSIVENITLSVVGYTESKGINIIFDTDVEEKIMACDPDKIERIILNLLSNAVKFTEPGGSIMVNLYDRGENISISLKDTGTGIPEDKLDMIFERFRQVDKSLARVHEGSGIGLSLVKSLVEMYDGKISVASEYGKGSEFIIELPVKVFSGENHITQNNDMEQGFIERINIEFSDIYSAS